MKTFFTAPAHSFEAPLLAAFNTVVIFLFGLALGKDVTSLAALAITIGGVTWLVGYRVSHPRRRKLKIWTLKRALVIGYACILSAGVATVWGVATAIGIERNVNVVVSTPTPSPIIREIFVSPCPATTTLYGPGPAGSYICQIK
jgi:hypothetical protein